MFKQSLKVISALLAGCVAASLLGACATQQLEGFDEASIAVPETTALTGTALIQRKFELERAFADMGAFQTTMEGMIDRRDRSGVGVFSDFVMTYMRNHLNPLLRAEWQSSHAELIVLDANLRVLQAELLIQMRQTKEVERRLEEIERRYAGRGALLIAYPPGEQSTLGEARAVLESRIGVCDSNRARWGNGSRLRDKTRGDVQEQTICVGPS